MAVVIRPSSPTSIQVVQGAQPSGAVVVKKAGGSTLQSLSNVDTNDLQDGYTLIYDSVTNLWVSQPIDNIAITVVDGGTY